MPIFDIAGINVSMTPMHSLTESRAMPYRINETDADMTLVGGGDPNEEYARLAISFYQQLLEFDGFLLHASAVEYEGKAVAFSASSGTGKSTHSSFWRQEFGAAIINDDKPAIRLIRDTVFACGTPFSGKAALSRNVCVPLYAIVFLTRSDITTVRRLSTEESLFRILSQTLRPSDGALYDRLLRLIEQVIRQIPVFEAGVPNNPVCAYEIKNAIGM